MAIKKNKSNLTLKRLKAIRIIEEIVEPLMGLMATNIRHNKKATIKSILKELELGMEGEAYYEMEDAIVEVLK